MIKYFRNLIFFPLFFIPVISYAGYSGTWANNCEDGKDYFVLSRSHNSGPYMVVFCAGYKCISKPGVSNPTSLVDDPVFKILSDSEIILNGKTYFKCNEIKEAQFEPVRQTDISKYLVGAWLQVAQITKGVEGPVRSYHYKETLWKISNKSISSSRMGKQNWERRYELKDEIIAVYNKGKWWRHYKILSIGKGRLYVSELGRPSEAIRVFERQK